jgi:molybdopterin-guanine dinucleotide biosynthesis protein A
LRVGSERLVDRAARVLTTACDPVIEVGPGYASAPVRSVRESPVGSGPLAALVAGGDALAARGGGDHPFVVLAVDMPAVDLAFVTWLRDFDSDAAVVPRVDGAAQPLCARYPASAVAIARDLLARDRRAMHALLDAIDVQWADVDAWGSVASPETFADIDTPDDATRWVSKGPGSLDS